MDDSQVPGQEVRDAAGEARYERTAFIVMLAAFVLMPMVIYPRFGSQLLCFAMFACAFNLLIGFGGLLSFGHAMFFGMGSYLAAHARLVWGFPIELAILTGAGTALAMGVLAGLIAIRRQGIYFAMITLALAQMVYFFCLRAPFTGGENGIQAVPRGKVLGLIDLSQPLAMYYFVLVVFLVAFALIHRIIHSPFGQVLKAIRENEPRMGREVAAHAEEHGVAEGEQPAEADEQVERAREHGEAQQLRAEARVDDERHEHERDRHDDERGALVARLARRVVDLLDGFDVGAHLSAARRGLAAGS
jgi:hypothetical protein